MIEVAWFAGDSSRYPYLWLRDNCQCENCFHPVSLSRSNYLKDLDLNVEPVEIQTSQESNELQIKWSDGHVSSHDSSWLRVRAFETDFRGKRDRQHKLPRKLWKAELPRVRWCDLLRSEEAVLTWLQLLETYGLVMITDAPKLPGCVGILADKVAFVRKTHYGEEFSVIQKPNPSNVAYSNVPLALHLDLPYYLHKPGVQLIHFVRQIEGEGGETQVSDAVQVAEHLRQVSPELFEVLSTTPVDWMDDAREGGRDHYKLLKMPVICLDSDGKCVTRINFSQPQRDSFFSECPLEKVNDWYFAMKTFHDLLYDPKFCRSFKMESGSMMCLDNLRVTHGRTGYPETASRHVDGCYIDWDEVRSRRRVLERRFGSQAFQG